MSFTVLCIIGLIFGIGFGFFVQRAGLCFAHGLGEIFINRGKRIIRMFVIIFIITAAGFVLSEYIRPGTGLKTIGNIRGYGFYNILSGIFFGMGIFMNGGCILGTLRQLGEGNLTYLIALLCFIPGMALVVFVVDPYLKPVYDIQNKLLPDLMNLPPLIVTAVLIIAALIWYRYVQKK